MSSLDSTTLTEIEEWLPFLIPTDNQYAWRVEDAEEEIFLLYSQLQGSARQGSPDDGDNEASKESGLGCVNPKDGQITVTLPVCRCQTCNDVRTVINLEHLSRHRTNSKRSRVQFSPTEISLYQNITSLNSRKGDTGSVLWRASKKIAASTLSGVLLSHAHVATCQILELGAGIGFLAVALAPLVKRYVATDLAFLMPLIAKNISQNSNRLVHTNVSIETLDWIEFQSLSMNNRSIAYKDIWVDSEDFRKSMSSRIILVVDCIYNPSLIDPLVTVINHFATCNGHKAIVLVVLELRAEEVTRLFLWRWIFSGQWEIWSLNVLGPQYAVWIGRQKS